MDVNISIDLNKALEPSLNVASAAAVSGIYANLTTNASQWEPGEFSNGVNNWGSNNVFILHNSGSAQGANQRYAYLGIATTKPFTLKQVQLNIDTNAGGSSAQNPVSVAVEISPRDDFLTVTPLGTVVSHHNLQTLALNAFIPYGTTYVRLRVTSPIYDGSNYVAYSGITLAGSTIADAVVSEPEPISPTSGVGLASQETFSITYDFNRASSQGALVVAALAGATPNMVSLLASNANQWEPGEFMNGVQSFGPNHNVYCLHNAGTGQSSNQRYLYATIATQLPLVLSQVSIPFSTNASGSGPSNPVAMQIEASTTADFSDMSILGTVTQLNGTVETTALLPRGVNYVRFRAIAPIYDGSNYIAFENITLSGSVAADDWDQIGVSAKQILTVGTALFVVNKDDGAIWRYSGTPNNWTRIGDATHQVIGAESGLYAITAAKDHVVAWNETTHAWDVIGGAMESLMTGRHVLHAVDSNNMVWMYNGTPNSWMQLGGPYRNVVATDEYCIAITMDGSSVELLQRGSTTWTTIGGPMASLRAAANALYGLDALGMVFRWSGSGTVWTPLGGPFRQLMVDGNTLLGHTTDRLAAMKLEDDNPVRWREVGQRLDSVTSNKLYYAGLRNGNVLIHFKHRGGQGSTPALAARRSGQVLAAADQGHVDPPADSDFGKNWIFQVHTQDVMLAGYDGNMDFKLGNDVQTLTDASFVRGEAYIIPMTFHVRETDSLGLGGGYHHWPDHWAVGKIQAWSLEQEEFYEFDIDGWVPNFNDDGHWITKPATMPTQLADPPTYARVFVWDYYNINRVGHASMLLSDGTYISWWPLDGTIKTIPFVEQTWEGTGVAVPDYSGDYESEGNIHANSFRVWGIDNAAVKAWWDDFKGVEGQKWKLTSQNCSTIVYKAILAGGVIPDRWKGQTEAVPAWTPNRIASLAMILATKNYPQWYGLDFLGLTP